MLFLSASGKVTARLRQKVTTLASPGVNNATPLTWFSEGYRDTGIHKHTYEPDAIYTPLLRNDDG